MGIDELGKEANGDWVGGGGTVIPAPAYPGGRKLHITHEPHGKDLEGNVRYRKVVPVNIVLSEIDRGRLTEYVNAHNISVSALVRRLVKEELNKA